MVPIIVLYPAQMVSTQIQRLMFAIFAIQIVLLARQAVSVSLAQLLAQMFQYTYTATAALQTVLNISIKITQILQIVSVRLVIPPV